MQFNACYLTTRKLVHTAHILLKYLSFQPTLHILFDSGVNLIGGKTKPEHYE